MISVRLRQSHVLETKLADVEHRLSAVVLGVRGEVPRVNLVTTDLHLVNVLDLRNLRGDTTVN